MKRSQRSFRFPSTSGRALRKARLALETLEDRALMSAGALDLSFGTNGQVFTSLATSGNSFINDLAIQADGKIIVAGQSVDDSNLVHMTVARFNPDGTLDSSFGSAGKSVINVTGTRPDEATRLLLQPDGKILVGGVVIQPTSDFALARLQANGKPDLTFGTSGIVTTSFSPQSGQILGLALQPDGKILAAGMASSFSGTSADIALARYRPDGSLDPDFDADGKVLTDVSPADFASSVFVLPDGKILVVGSIASHIALLRYFPDGGLDTSFGDNGKKIDASSVAPKDALLQAGGTLLIAGALAGDFALARYDLAGNPDSSFGSGGTVVTDFAASSDFGRSVAVQPNGKIVVAGDSSAGGGFGNFALARYNPDGTLDTSFSFDGKTLTDFNGGSDVAEAVAIAADGKIVVGGGVGDVSVTQFGLARYEGDPIPKVTVDDTAVFEGDGGTLVRKANFTVHLAEPSSVPLTLNYQTRDGTAFAGSDYQASNGTVTFAANTQTATISVTLIGNTVVEPNEKFFVDLGGTGVFQITDGTGQATIVDDDASASTLSGFVYDDSNFNGLRDSGEAGVGGATVRLYQQLSTGEKLIGTQQTATSGFYSFGNLPTGGYRLEEDQPSNYSDGPDQAGLLGATVGNDSLSTIKLAAGVSATDYNFGEHAIVQLRFPALFPNRSVTSPIPEGSEAVVTGMVFDPNPHDQFILDIKWGDGSPVETHHYAPGHKGEIVQFPHRYRDDGVYTVHLAWRDQDGLGNQADLQVVVENVPPQLEPLRDVTLGARGRLDLPVVFHDPGRDTWTAVVDYGDGVVEQRIGVRAGKPFALRHDYAQPGKYQVTVAVIDDRGDIGTQRFSVTVSMPPGKVQETEAPAGQRALDQLFALVDAAQEQDQLTWSDGLGHRRLKPVNLLPPWKS